MMSPANCLVSASIATAARSVRGQSTGDGSDSRALEQVTARTARSRGPSQRDRRFGDIPRGGAEFLQDWAATRGHGEYSSGSAAGPSAGRAAQEPDCCGHRPPEQTPPGSVYRSAG